MGDAAHDILLASLASEPNYGYRLRDVLGAVGRDPDSVYKALESLRRKKWVREVGEREAGRQGAPKAILEPTVEGLTRVETWIRSSLDLEAFGADLIARMYVARPEHLPILLSRAREQLAECTGTLARAGGDRRPLATPTSGCSWKNEIALHALDREETTVRGYVPWLRRVCASLEARIDDAS